MSGCFLFAAVGILVTRAQEPFKGTSLFPVISPGAETAEPSEGQSLTHDSWSLTRYILGTPDESSSTHHSEEDAERGGTLGLLPARKLSKKGNWLDTSSGDTRESEETSEKRLKVRRSRGKSGERNPGQNDVEIKSSSSKEGTEEDDVTVEKNEVADTDEANGLDAKRTNVENTRGDVGELKMAREAQDQEKQLRKEANPQRTEPSSKSPDYYEDIIDSEVTLRMITPKSHGAEGHVRRQVHNIILGTKTMARTHGLLHQTSNSVNSNAYKDQHEAGGEPENLLNNKVGDTDEDLRKSEADAVEDNRSVFRPGGSDLSPDAGSSQRSRNKLGIVRLKLPYEANLRNRPPGLRGRDQVRRQRQPQVSIPAILCIESNESVMLLFLLLR